MGGLKKSEIELIIDFLVKKLSPYTIILFGSAAKSQLRPDSDIDIAFLTDQPVEPYETFAIAQELAYQLKRDVDLINLQQSSTVFKTQIIGNGQVIYDGEPEKRIAFQMQALKAYAKLNEERKPILDIKENGSGPFSMNDIIHNKLQTIKRCIGRIHEEYDNNISNLNIYTKHDAIILNTQRVCEACIDLAMHIISEQNLGIPQNSRDAFELLYQNHLIHEDLNKRMQAMVGFRNIAVPDYQSMNLDIVKNIIEKRLMDFDDFTEQVLKIME